MTKIKHDLRNSNYHIHEKTGYEWKLQNQLGCQFRLPQVCGLQKSDTECRTVAVSCIKDIVIKKIQGINIET